MTNCFRKYKEHVVYLMIWAILFLAPVISMYLEVRSGKEIQFVWKPVVDIWKIYILYLVAFLIHNFLIAPILVDKKKAGKYLILASSLVVVFFFAQSYLRPEPPTTTNAPRRNGAPSPPRPAAGQTPWRKPTPRSRPRTPHWQPKADGTNAATATTARHP